jgi:MFS family permease
MNAAGLREHRDYRRLWLADAVSQVGNQVTLLAMPLVAVLVLHATTFQIGLLVALEFVGFLVLGLPAGAWCDRWRRRPIMVSADLVRALVLASVPIAYVFDLLTIWQLFVVVLLQGMSTVFFDVAALSYLPSLLPQAHLMAGNARLQANESVAQVAGPTVAGALIQLVTAPVALAVDAVSFLGSAVLLRSIRTTEPRPEPLAERHLGREVAEGLRVVLRHQVLRAIAGSLAISSFCSAMFAAVVIVFLADDLGTPPGVIGLVMSAGSVGGLAGAMVTGRLAGRLGEFRAVWLPYTVTAPFGLLIPLAAPGFRLLLFTAGWLGFSFALVSYSIAQVSLRQRLCPRNLLGRVNATIRFLGWGLMPLGGLIGGALASWLGTRDTLWVTQVGQLLVPVVLVVPLTRWGNAEAAAEPEMDVATSRSKETS